MMLGRLTKYWLVDDEEGRGMIRVDGASQMTAYWLVDEEEC